MQGWKRMLSHARNDQPEHQDKHCTLEQMEKEPDHSCKTFRSGFLKSKPEILMRKRLVKAWTCWRDTPVPVVIP
jgi:hypothetical protein